MGKLSRRRVFIIERPTLREGNAEAPEGHQHLKGFEHMDEASNIVEYFGGEFHVVMVVVPLRIDFPSPAGTIAPQVLKKAQ
ncbi:hypothetical protein PsorP6_011800 [Peronosclerospora sorghi]|uniref:Uncharacterized protein n=1 Tax=Peronosclerospora sorghi TaxID=230839 RepID=A0ACC0WKW9_9STRA|nr:hypothetical protein PsorP6_011800 [Peronosclerospora sorghi]